MWGHYENLVKIWNKYCNNLELLHHPFTILKKSYAIILLAGPGQPRSNENSGAIIWIDCIIFHTCSKLFWNNPAQPGPAQPVLQMCLKEPHTSSFGFVWNLVFSLWWFTARNDRGNDKRAWVYPTSKHSLVFKITKAH